MIRKWEIRSSATLFARNDTGTDLGSNLPFRGEMLAMTRSMNCGISIHWFSRRPTTGPCPTSDAFSHFQVFQTHFEHRPPPPICISDILHFTFYILHVVHRRLRWSKWLACWPLFRGFKPGRSRWIFRL
jgi:hypothetical protein